MVMAELLDVEVALMSTSHILHVLQHFMSTLQQKAVLGVKMPFERQPCHCNW